MVTKTYTIASGSKLNITKTNVTAFATGENECISSINVGSFKISQVKNTGPGAVGVQFDFIPLISSWYDVEYSSSAKTVTVPAEDIDVDTRSTRNIPYVDSIVVWSDLESAPTLSSSITITFIVSTYYTCTINSSNNGSVNAYRKESGSYYSFLSGADIYEGNEIRLRASPNEKCRFVRFDTSPSVEITYSTTSGYTYGEFAMPSEPITITPVFERYIFDVSIGQSQFGTASASAYTGEAGDTITLTAYPDSGYQLLRWDSYPYVAINNNSFTMPNHDVAITPVFKKIPANITAGYYNGSTYLPSTPMYYDGTNWIECEWKHYNGSSWDNADSL